MTFDPQKWIQQSGSADDTKTVKIANEEIKIRRLNGVQWEHYVRIVNGKSDDSSIAVILQYGLVKGFGNYSYEDMVKFYNATPVLADRIASAIVELTLQRMEIETKILEDAEKNSERITTPLPCGDGVVSTDKTQEPQESAV